MGKYTLQEIHIVLGQVVRLLLEVQVQIQKNYQLLYMGRITFTSGGLYGHRRRTFMQDSSDLSGGNASSLVIHRGRLAVTNLESTGDHRMGISLANFESTCY